MSMDEILDLMFKMVAAWIGLNFYSVYIQTRSYGHLLVSLGVVFTFLVNLFLDSEVVGRTLLILGRILFWGGFAAVATFGGSLERERLRRSSWKEILLGRVPDQLRTQRVGEKQQVIQGMLISLLFAGIFYLAGRQHEALSFLVIGIVYTAYLGSLGFGREKGSE